MSFGFNQLRLNAVRKIDEKEVVVKTSVSEMESGGATKILDVVASARITSIDVSADTARVSGRVNFKLLYTDREGEIRGLDYFADFNDYIQTDSLSCDLYGKIAVIDTDTSISGGIKLSAVVRVTLFSLCDKEVECLVSADDEYYIEKDTITCNRLRTSFSSSFTVTDDFDTATDVMKVVLTDATSYIDNISAGNGNVLLSGGVNAVVTYLADDTAKTATFRLPFSEELENDGLAIGQSLTADSEIKNVRVLLTGVEGSNIIRIEVEVGVTVKAYEMVGEEIIGDIFSVTHELIEKRERSVESSFIGFKYFSDNLSGVATIGAESPAALEVISVISGNNTVAQAVAEDNRILIEGVYTSTVLYRDENGLNSVMLEVPYSLPFMYEAAESGNNLAAVGTVIRAEARLKRDREIEVNAVLGFMTELYGENVCEYISQLELGAEKDVNQSAVSVYLAEDGESVWDAAKALSARPDDIKAQNPDLSEPMKEGDKVFYFRRINFDF